MRPTVALLAAFVLAVAVAPGSAVASEPSFCKSQTLHDYLTPFQRMPKLRERPFRRRAEPFFHGVRIGSSGPPPAINGGHAGYQLQWQKNPGWNLTLTFTEVNPQGAVLRRSDGTTSASARWPRR